MYRDPDEASSLSHGVRIMKKNETKTGWDLLSDLVAKDIFPSRLTSLLLWGPPGTGKSTWARSVFGADRCEIVPLSDGVDQFGLLGAMLPASQIGRAHV